MRKSVHHKPAPTDAERLRSLIEQSGLTVPEFAERIEYGERQLYYMLSGARPVRAAVMLAAERLATQPCRP